MKRLMQKLTSRRAALRAAIVSMIAVALVGSFASVANASVGGTVHTASGVNVTVRASPGTGWDAWTSVKSGSSVTILCKAGGNSVTGYYGTTSTWYMLSNGGFATAAYVHANSTPVSCNYSPSPPRPNPRGRNSAISHAFESYHSTGYEGWCLKFVAIKYGWSYSGWRTAEVGGDWIYSHGYMHGGVPPRGALVWYHNSSGTGHVAISLGKGKVIGTSVNGSVGVSSYTYHSSYRGWSAAYFPVAG